MTSLKLIGHDNLFSFNEWFSANHFYDIIAPRLTSLDTIYVLHITSYNHYGIPFSEWITVDLSKSSTYIAVMELHSYINNTVNKCNKMNSDLASSIIFEDGKDDLDVKVKSIYITYYIYL